MSNDTQSTLGSKKSTVNEPYRDVICSQDRGKVSKSEGWIAKDRPINFLVEVRIYKNDIDSHYSVTTILVHYDSNSIS